MGVERLLQLMLVDLHLSRVAALRDEWWGGREGGNSHQAGVEVVVLEASTPG